MEIKINMDGLMSVQDAAKELGVPRMSVHRWVDGNKLVGVNFNGILFIPTSEVARCKKDRQNKKVKPSIKTVSEPSTEVC